MLMPGAEGLDAFAALGATALGSWRAGRMFFGHAAHFPS
jgi:hypothetical protein